MKPSTIHKYAERVRSWMNQPQTARRLRRQLVRWNQLNSCLDTLQHTELAIQAFASHAGGLSPGERYLAIYGLLQAMVLQQDAVCNLDEALGGPGDYVVRDERLQEIRKIRNWSVGHPTKADRRDSISHHHIRRARLGSGFELYSAFDDGRHEFTFVSLAELIAKQRAGLRRILRRIVRELHAANIRTPVVIRRRLSPAVAKARAARERLKQKRGEVHRQAKRPKPHQAHKRSSGNTPAAPTCAPFVQEKLHEAPKRRRGQRTETLA